MSANPPRQACLRRDALIILQQALLAVEPETAVKAVLKLNGGQVTAGNFNWQPKPLSRVFLIGGGKAAGPMAAAAGQLLSDLNPSGLLVTKYGHSVPLRQVRLLEAGHPLPDMNGLNACQEMLNLAEQARPDDLVICLLSGGASALLPAPAEGITLAEKLRSTDLLLRAGANISQLNTLRKQLSQIKGGRLAKAVAPAALLTLVISDVIGDPPDIIASGPTVTDRSTVDDALQIISNFRLTDSMPEAVMAHLRNASTPKQTYSPEGHADNLDQLFIIANIEQAANAARAKAAKLGYRAEILTTALSGEAQDAARVLVTQAQARQRLMDPGEQPLCLISGGETTVTVTGSGKGGRNQELALAAAIELQGSSGITLLAAGTDGTDGPTDAAGAIVDGMSWRRGKELGLNAASYLRDNDSYHYFSRLNDLVVIGPTRTNVMDLNLLLVTPATAS